MNLLLFVLPGLGLWLFGSCEALRIPCQQLANKGDCDFYLCLDRHLGGCGTNGYLIGYGHKYCTRFTSHRALFSLEGREWMDGVRRCLMTVLLNAYANAPPSPAHDRTRSCDYVSAVAFASHEACYVGNGFCHMIGHCRNIQASFQVAEFRDIVPFMSPFYWQTTTLIFHLLGRCPESTRQDLIHCTTRCPDLDWMGALATSVFGILTASCESSYKAAMVFVVDDYRNITCDDHHWLREEVGTMTNGTVLLVDTVYSGTSYQAASYSTGSHLVLHNNETEIGRSLSALVDKALDLLQNYGLCSHVAKVIIMASDTATKVDTEAMSIALLAAQQSGVRVCVQPSSNYLGAEQEDYSHLVLTELDYEPVLSCSSFLISLISEKAL